MTDLQNALQSKEMMDTYFQLHKTEYIIKEIRDYAETNATTIDGNTMLSAGWISVKERMPPDVTPVLVFGWCCDICHNIRIAEYEGDGWWESFHGDNLSFKPEYWMPLPFPSDFGLTEVPE